MIIKTAAILLFLFIFGITTQGYADSVKSKKNTVNQETIMKIDESRVALQKKTMGSKESTNLLETKKAKSQSSILYSDVGEIIVSAQFDVNFLKTLKEKKKTSFTEYLDEAIYFYGVPQNAWGGKFFNVKGVTEAKSSNPEDNAFHLESYPPGNRSFEERRILETFKLLQFKRGEIYKEIFMGFRFSFNPVSGHMFLEMNVTPSFEKGSGFNIPF
jgi:hypothetical protein